MQDEYSIETRTSKIFDAKTKEYFSEVLSCYIAGNYRSAVVMLWSVAVCDLLFKLQNLVDLYGDDKAKTILDKIRKQQKGNERSPIWEKTLVESVAKETQLLDVVELGDLLELQRQRHLAAHPVVTENFELHRPNRETTRALIRNTLDGLLTKAPILSKQIIDELVKDLAQRSETLFIDDKKGNKKLKAYLESKYFNRFNPEVEKAVFKALWKFTFRYTDEPYEKNRSINYRTLRLLYLRNRDQFRKQVNSEKDYFSKIASGGDPVVCLIRFLSQAPRLYECLEDHAKTEIQYSADNNISAKCLAWFTKKSLNEHASDLDKRISGKGEFVAIGLEIDRDTWAEFKAISGSPEWSKSVIRLANKNYGLSSSFDEAKQRFNDTIRPLLQEYKIDDCIDLIKRIDKNNLTWGRGLADTDHHELRSRVLDLDPNFDFSPHDGFNFSLTLLKSEFTIYPMKMA